MQTYIALLRGINVSGQKIIKMENLRSLFSELGFQNVQTYIQSGNVVFNSKTKSIRALEKTIHDGIKRRFKYEVEVFVIDSDEIESVCRLNPFKTKQKSEFSKIYVTICSEEISKQMF